ncbi:MAG: alpha/beta hydrolase [Bacteriovoracaceae bacterium]|nr:alpha/beta hydrolase [Bacteroidota bacterium]
MHNGSFNLLVDSTSLHYSIIGSGEPLLICPVTWGVDGHRWTTLDELAKHFTLIRLDPRGTGTSGSVQEKSEYGIPTLVRDIEALRIHLGIDRWNIMGQSAAGWTALEYTLAHQSQVNTLTVVCSVPTGKFHKGTFRDPSHPLYNKFELISKEIRTLPASDRVKAFNRAVYQFDVQTEEARRTIDAIFSSAEFNTQRNQYFVMNELNRYNVTEQLHELSVPTLIIGGTHDVHVSPKWSTMMAHQISAAQLVMLEHSGHFPWLDEPEQFFAAVTSFLEKHSKSRVNR